MARKGDGLYLRGSVWYLDCRIDGQRHVVKLGKGIRRTVAAELASVKRAAILKGQPPPGQVAARPAGGVFRCAEILGLEVLAVELLEGDTAKTLAYPDTI